MAQEAAQRQSSTEAVVQVVNPATGTVVGQVPNLAPDEVADLVARGRAAQPAWNAAGFAQRAAHMRRLRGWLVQERQRVIDVMRAEAGKTHEDALLEVFHLCNALGFWARQAERYLAEQRTWTRSPFLPGRKMVVRHEPRGVIGVIAPWNYPLVLGLGDAIPALMAGNAIVLKPSSITPLSSQLVVEEGMRAAGFPAGVCTVATGGARAGGGLIDHADMIMFTGSAAVGRDIAARAGRRLIPVSLELGGKDAMVVLADANLERAADAAVFHAMVNSGQTCMSVERVYVEAPAYDRFVQLVVERVGRLRQGAVGGPGEVDVGSLTGPGQIDLVEEQVQAAVAAGARVLCGGHRGKGGDFFEPTVLVDVDHSMACMTEETFGPTLPIMRVRDADEAVRLANDSAYGLNSSVFTRDLAKGESIARRIQAGSCCVNDAVVNYTELRAPFNGWKESGLGGRHGPEGIRKYCRQQSILLTRFTPGRDPIAFPHTRLTTGLIERLMTTAYGRRHSSTDRRTPR